MPKAVNILLIALFFSIEARYIVQDDQGFYAIMCSLTFSHDNRHKEINAWSDFMQDESSQFLSIAESYEIRNRLAEILEEEEDVDEKMEYDKISEQ